MTELRPGYWGEVVLGSVIQDPYGCDWKIKDERSGWLLMVDRTGRELSIQRPLADGEVKLWGQSIPDAVRVAADILGGVEIHDDGGPTWRSQVFPVKGSGEIARAKAHLWIMHFEYVADVKGPGSLESLIECHDYNHEPAQYDQPGVRKHTHGGH